MLNTKISNNPLKDILDDNINDNILETNITIEQSGVPTFILRQYCFKKTRNII